MLKLACDRCGAALSEPGALLFSPPTSEAWIVEKYHICAQCWPEVLAELRKARPDVEGKLKAEKP
jgi:hypothetical protein